jgi:hypothetical protein
MMWCTPLHGAADSSSLAVLQTLITLGADRSARCLEGDTPLRVWSDAAECSR